MQRPLVGFLVAVLILSGLAVNGADYLDEPEGIAFDSLYNRYLIANWADGSISQIDARYGLRSYFQTGLGYCADIYVAGDVVFVTCNNRNLMGFDLTTGEEVIDIFLSPDHLHGITSDTSGNLYVSDRIGSKIYKVSLSDFSHSTLVSGSVIQPLGMCFDPDSNRIVVVSRALYEDIKAISLPKPTVTELVDHEMGCLDGITVDSRGYYYITTIFNPFNQVYRYDPLFTDPPELILDGLNEIVDVCYNRQDEILAVTVAYSNSVEFIEMLVSFDADTLIGWPSLDVSFAAESDSAITSWLWDFGDGELGTGQNPFHTYTTAGAFDVTLRAVTSADDTLYRTKEDYICILADSLLPDSVEYGEGDTLAELVINIVNYSPLTEIQIPVEYGGDIDLTYMGWSLSGCAPEGIAEISIAHSDPANKLIALRLRTTGINYLPPGSWPVLKLFFHPDDSLGAGGVVPVSMDGYGTRVPVFSGPLGTYTPATGERAVIVQSCCILGGDVDHSGELNISDLTSLVDYMFGDDILICSLEADVDGSGQLDISDLTYLVEYLFGGGSPPTEC